MLIWYHLHSESNTTHFHFENMNLPETHLKEEEGKKILLIQLLSTKKEGTVWSLLTSAILDNQEDVAQKEKEKKN